MICKRCGNEVFRVLRVYRNKKRIKGNWIFDGNYDTRIIMCSECGTRRVSPTYIGGEIIFKNFRKYEDDGQQTFEFKD